MTVLHRAREQGASLVEFALVCGVFFFLLLTFIDFVRILSVQVALTTGAQKGLQLAQRIPGGELDIRASTTNDDLYRRYAEARRQVLDLAVSFPAATFVDPSNRPKSASQLRGFQHRDLLTDRAITTTVVTDAILLRPGEQAISSDGQTIIDHPTICPPQGTYASRACQNIPTPPSPPPPETRRRITPDDKWSDLLQKTPIMVELCANVQLFIPGFREPVRTCRRALGYRVVPQSAGPGAGSFTPTTLVCQPDCSGKEVKTPGEGCSCYCPEFSCNGNYSRSTSPCDCVCDANKLNASCRAKGPNWTGNTNSCTCRCTLTSCPVNYSLNTSTCSCQCSGSAANCSGSTPDWDAAGCRCWCDASKGEASCTSDEYFDRDQCRCAEKPAEERCIMRQTRWDIYPTRPSDLWQECEDLCSSYDSGRSHSKNADCRWNSEGKYIDYTCCQCADQGRIIDQSTGSICCPYTGGSQVPGSQNLICCGSYYNGRCN